MDKYIGGYASAKLDNLNCFIG